MLENLKSKMTRPAAALGMGLLVAFAGAGAADAQQQVNAPQQRVTACPTIKHGYTHMDSLKLGCADLRGHGDGAAKVAAIAGSGRFVVLKIHTNDQKVIKEVDHALREMLMAGYPKLRLLLADGPKGADQTAEMYVGGFERPLFTFRNIDASNVRASLHEGIRDAYKHLPTQQAANAADGPSAERK